MSYAGYPSATSSSIMTAKPTMVIMVTRSDRRMQQRKNWAEQEQPVGQHAKDFGRKACA